MTESLIIDFADRDDVRAKLPEARRILDEKHSALNAAQADWNDWSEFVTMLARRAGIDDAPEPHDADSTAESTGHASPEPAAESVPEIPAAGSDAAPLNLVVEVVSRANRKIRAQDVTEILRQEGHELAKVAVSNALFYAAKRAKPPRLKQATERGFYAPLNYQENPFLEGADLRGVDLAEIFTGDGDA
jgi:hypothetical protein